MDPETIRLLLNSGVAVIGGAVAFTLVLLMPKIIAGIAGIIKLIADNRERERVFERAAQPLLSESVKALQLVIGDMRDMYTRHEEHTKRVEVRMVALEAEHSQQQVQITDLRAQLDAKTREQEAMCRDFEKRITGMQTEIDELKAENQRLEAENNRLKNTKPTQKAAEAGASPPQEAQKPPDEKA